MSSAPDARPPAAASGPPVRSSALSSMTQSPSQRSTCMFRYSCRYEPYTMYIYIYIHTYTAYYMYMHMYIYIYICKYIHINYVYTI